MKVFLSHSSKQKSYVEQVASILGKENIIYDSWTFEEGNKTLEEIYKGIEKTGVFTFFISKDSLSSEWVKKELFFAEKFIDENRIKKFIPIIIDPSLNHKSNEIPEWMKKCNIKYIHKPGRSAVRIKNELLSIRAENLPIVSKEEQLFIGRNDEKKFFEERYYSSEEEKPIVFVVNGLPKIGKRKFIKKVLIDSNIIETYYKPEVLELDRRNSIEDLILQLYGLGFSKEDENRIESMLSLDINEKIDLCIRLINELSNSGEMLIIVDNQFIFSKDGECAPWFVDLVNRFEPNYDGIKFCIASMARVRESYKKFKNNSLFNQTIKEFLKHERRAYFEQLLKIRDIELNQKDKTDIIECCTGIPEQIRFAVNILKSGEYNVTECIQRIVEFNRNNSSVLIEEYENNTLALQLLKFLSMGEFFSYSLVYSIFKDEEKEKINFLLTSFNNNLIIESVADGFEFIKLTDSVKDYIERRNYKLEDKYLNLIRSMASNTLNSSEFIDSSEVSFYTKEAIKLGMDMPNKYLIPSFYLNAMRELYNYEKRYSVVVKLANKVLEYEKNIDQKIIKEIIYWCCLSLARLRNKEVLSRVQKINGVDHNFILGFYYRIIGNNDKAIEKLKLVLDVDSNHFRAKRELVQVYINTEEYKLAYDIAKQNYESEPSNPYNIQSYFKCLIKREDVSARKDTLQGLLDALYNSQHEKSAEMFSTSNAQFIAYIENNYTKAIIEIDEAIHKFPKNIYPFLVKLEIIRNKDDIDYEELDKTLSLIKETFDKDNDIFNKLIYIVCEILQRKNYLLDKDSAEKYFSNKVIGKFPDKTIENIRKLLD